MVLHCHCSVQVLYPYVLIRATEKVIKPRPCRIYLQKTGNCFWSVNYTRSKIPFLCSGNKLQIFQLNERLALIHTEQIMFIKKMESQGNIAYLWENDIIVIFEHF